MTFTILPLEEHDIPDFVRVDLAAFRSHPRMPMLWPRGYPDELYAFYNDNNTKSFHDEDCRFMKAVDEDGQGAMVAGAEWTFALDAEANAKEGLGDPNEQPPANWPQEGNWPLRRYFKIEWKKWRRETLAGKAYILLDTLVVDPSYQGRGAGAQLLSWGCQEADKLGVMVCLESTPAGLSLYKRFGFREIRTVKADMREFGWTKSYDEEAAKRVYMVRDARSKTA